MLEVRRRQVLCQCVDRCLRRFVGRNASRRDRSDRANVDDGSTTRRSHRRNGMFARQEHSSDVHVLDVIPGLELTEP